MRLLFVHTRFPLPARSGMDKVRLALLRVLMLKHQVTLLAPLPAETPAGDVEHVRSFCSEFLGVPQGPSVRRSQSFLWLRRWSEVIVHRRPIYLEWEFHPSMAVQLKDMTSGRRYDAVQLCSNFASAYYPYVHADMPVAFGPIDDYVAAAEMNGQLAQNFRDKLAWRLHARARAAFEVPVARRCQRVFFHQVNDLNRFARLAGGLPTARVLPHPVEPEDPPEFSMEDALAEEEPDTILFVGGLGSAFNSYAVEHFVRDIWPEVRAAVTSAQFLIVGSHPSARIKALANQPGITLAANVPDVTPWLRKAAITISPVRSGTGIKTKAVEALAYGKPLVAYPEGVQGLRDTGPICIENSASGFAKTIICLLNDTTLRHRIARAAREHYLSTYCFNAMAPCTLSVYEEWQRELKL